MLNEAGLFEKAALTLLRGGKLNQSELPPALHSLYNQLLRMHAGHFIAAEPQTYIRLIKDAGIDSRYLGLSHINPLPAALLQETELLISVARQKGADIADFEVLGLNHDKRSDWRTSKNFELDDDKAAILLPGDIASLWQGMNLIGQRLENPNVHYTAPIIVQNSGHFWEPLLNTPSSNWKKERKALEKLNIFVSAGAAETADMLAQTPFGKKVSPQNIVPLLTSAKPVEQEDEVVFTTDKIKLGHIMAGQKANYEGDSVHMGIDVIGPFPSPDEQTHSLEGNADDKFAAVYDQHALLYKRIGREGVEKLYTDAGLTVSRVKITTNDGGWGACLENKNGDRKINLFPQRLFPNTVHKLNPGQMAPGVEYAYMKRTNGLEYLMTQLETRVSEVADKPNARFSRSQLVVYDTSVFMSVPLTRMLDAIEAGDPYDAAELGIVSVFSGQKLGVARKPYRGPYTGVVDTIDYFIPKTPHGNLQTRAEIPDWFMNGPNVEGHYLSKLATGVTPRPADAQLEPAHKRSRGTFKMGLLGSLDAMTQRTSSPTLLKLKQNLNANFAISTRQGPHYWDAYRNHTDLVLAQAGGETNTAYLAGTRLMLDASRVFFAGNTSRGDALTDKQKTLHLLPVIKAIVRNQVFNHTDVVVDAQSATGKMALDLVRRKQQLGLIQQRTEHLAHFVEGTEEAAQKISDIVKGKQIFAKPVKRQFFSDGQVERKDCMAVAVYCSATNCNKSLLDQYDRLGMLLAINGFSLKVGGGNDGLMKAVADGFVKGKALLKSKGYDFPNELILIQCVDTEAIEKRYEGEGIYRCHGSIEPRKADIQQVGASIFGSGGAGTDEEILAEFVSRMTGLIDTKRNMGSFFNSQMQTMNGLVGVHDFYSENFSPKFLESLNANHWSITPEEIVAQICLHRAKQQPEHTLSLSGLRATLKDEHNKVALAKPVGHFRTPFETFLGHVESLPEVSRIADKPDLALNHA